jgi:hypothetical protein
LPFTPSTVTVTSLPIITVSPTRLVNINIIQLLAYLALAVAIICRTAGRSASSVVRESNVVAMFTGNLQSLGQEYKITKPNCYNFVSE